MCVCAFFFLHLLEVFLLLAIFVFSLNELSCSSRFETSSLFSLSMTVAPLFLPGFFSLFFHLVSACPLGGAHFTLKKKKNINRVNQGRRTYIRCFWCQRVDDLVFVCCVTMFFPFVFVYVRRNGREHRVALFCFLLVLLLVIFFGGCRES